jgi:hypothetical protein
MRRLSSLRALDYRGRLGMQTGSKNNVGYRGLVSPKWINAQYLRYDR